MTAVGRAGILRLPDQIGELPPSPGPRNEFSLASQRLDAHAALKVCEILALGGGGDLFDALACGAS